MSKPYSTYIMGTQAIAAFAMPECAKNHWHLYRSNWRILHIDGFEPGFGSRLFHFKWATSVGDRSTFHDGVTWTNVGKAGSTPAWNTTFAGQPGMGAPMLFGEEKKS